MFIKPKGYYGLFNVLNNLHNLKNKNESEYNTTQNSTPEID